MRVVIVDDSPLALDVLAAMLGRAEDIRIVATAEDGRAGLDLVRQLRPDVLLTDLHMPGLDGHQLTRSVMADTPTPILVVSVSTTQDDVFRLLAAGAVDVYLKPETVVGPSFERKARELIEKVRVASGVAVVRRRAPPPVPPLARAAPLAPVGETCIVAIGASTGGPPALRTLLASLQQSFPVPVLCVQHIAEGFLDGLVEWLDRESKVRVKVAEHREIARPGTVYFAPERRHLVLRPGRVLELLHGAAVDQHVPSVTTTFNSVAAACGDEGVGILLTGMGNDGAMGLRQMRRAGALTIAQDAATSLVYGMPAQAAALGAARLILPLPEIARQLGQLQRRGSDA